MNPFQYTLGQVTKAAVSAVLFAFALAGFFIAYDPDLQQATVVVVLSLSAVISVFATPNHTVADVTKAVEQLKGSVLTVVGFIVMVPAAVEVQIGAAVAALLSFYPIWLARNAPPSTMVEDEVLEDVPEGVSDRPEVAGLEVEGDGLTDHLIAEDEGEDAGHNRREGVPPTQGGQG
jgi:hypothetical protein